MATKKGSEKSVELKLHAPQANKVSVAGDFNRWDTKSISARKDYKGTWKVKLDLAPGRYEYKFIVDGNWQNDPNCKMSAPNSFGSANSILIIS